MEPLEKQDLFQLLNTLVVITNMIKLKFKEINYPVKGVNEYEDIGGLPVSIVLDSTSNPYLFNTFFISGNEFFIELCFNSETQKFSQIAFVCLGESTTETNRTKFEGSKEQLFECYLESVEAESREISSSVKVEKFGKDLVFRFKDSCESNLYYVADNLAFKVDRNNLLCEVIVFDQKELIDSFDH